MRSFHDTDVMGKGRKEMQEEKHFINEKRTHRKAYH
jgi:hypothetical protein